MNLWQVDNVLFTAHSKDGYLLAVVAYTDGSYGLTRDQQPIPTFRWKEQRIEECMTAMVELAGLEGPRLQVGALPARRYSGVMRRN